MMMNLNSRILGTAAASCVLGLVAPQPSSATVSDEDFNALKSVVQQLQSERAQDKQQIQQLEQRLGETQSLATNAVERADAVAQAQATPGRNALHNFTMVGDAEVQYAKTFGNGTHNGFLQADFAPIFLYRASDKVLFEAGFDIMLQNGSSSGLLLDGTTPYTHDSGSATSIGMSFGQLDYIFNDYITLCAGDVLLPLGTYSERSAGWLNKIPDDPLGREFLPGSGIGAMLRGAVPVGESGQAVTYSVYCVNGPSSVDGSGNATTLDGNGSTIANLDLGGNVGILNSGATGNLHAAPTFGGRLAWFYPWAAHKDLEIGVSGQTGVWDDSGNHYYSAGVLDASLHLSPNFELKGEFINAWYGTADVGTVHPWAAWAQAGYKLAGLNLDLPVVNDVELVGRIDTENDGLGTRSDRYTMGYVYYLSNTLLFEGDYEFINSSGPNALPPNMFVLQISYGF
jgi:hypothetical protein